ncbi:MAG: response regulator [Gammaproteobacteria bacterium]|jgi:DNA-binding NtrC family response regulator|nr:response regulator [Gammaproteobacteria bacterium]
MNTKPRVLFVDDEPKILNSMRWLFNRDYELYFANSGQEAIDAIRRNKFHVIVSDQRMPGITGIEVLREAKKISPDTMRLLLTGYADLKAIVGSVNESEVFRFITKPWINEELKMVVKLAADTALHGPPVCQAAPQAVPVPAKSEILVIDEDPNVKHLLRQILKERYTLYAAETLDEALTLLDEHEIKVVVSETRVANTDITTLIKLLKKHRPDIISVVLTEHSDAKTIIDLINQGQVYRFLRKPVKPGQCRLSIQSAMIRNAQLRANPELIQRYVVDDLDEEKILANAHKGDGSAAMDPGMFRRMLHHVIRLPRLFSN